MVKHGIGQPVSALPSLQVNRTNTASPLNDSRPNNDINDEFSKGSYNKGDSNNKYSSDAVSEPSSSKKYSRWSKKDNGHLRCEKEEDKPWSWF